MPRNDSELVTRRLGRLAHLRQIRNPHEQHWERMAEVIIPRKRGMIRKLPPGMKLTDFQYDGTPTRSAEKLAAFIHGALTSTEYPFFGIQMRQTRLMDVKPIADYMEECSDRMLAAFSQSNWDAEAPESYLDNIVFGTASPMFIEEGDITYKDQGFGGIHFTALPLGDSWLMENRKNQIDTLYYVYTLPAGVVADSWEKTASQSTKSLAANRPYENVNILLVVEPRKKASREYPAFGWDMPFTCCYIEMDQRVLLEEKGFMEFPAPTSRWSRGNNDKVYGRGIGDTAYPDVKTLNEEVRLKLMSLAIAVFPPLMKDQGIVGGVRWLPGAVHEVDGKNLGMNPPIQPILNGANFNVAEFEEEHLRNAIKECFHDSLLQLPEAGKQMTAREVQIRLELMQRALGSTLGRFKSEFLDPTVERVFGIMVRANAFPPAPEELTRLRPEEAQLDIVYKGPLAMAQRSQDTVAIESQVEYMISLYQRLQDPSVLDPINLDEASWTRAEVSSVPSKVMRGKGEVAEIRDSRAQQNAAVAARQERTIQADELVKKAQAAKAISDAGVQAPAGGGPELNAAPAPAGSIPDLEAIA